MPQSLRDWLALIAVCLLFLGPSLSRADDLMECVSRGRLAAALVYDMSEGADLAQIKINAKFPPRNAVQQRDFDEWVAGIKGEVAMLLEGRMPPVRDEAFANRIGIKVAEKCAVEYGMARGDYKKTGSAKPQDAASSERITEENRCQQLKADLQVIADSLSGGLPMEQLKSMLKPAEMIGEETHARMIALIESAYNHTGTMADWMDRHYSSCR